MSEIKNDTLRALIRLIPPARALKEDLEKSIHLELYAGTGDMAVKSFQGLLASVARLTDDPYVEALSLSVSEDATDMEKVSLALLGAGQLAAYLEGQTGLVGMGGGGDVDIHTAPNINMLSGNVNIPPETAARAFDFAEKALKGKEDEQEEKAEQEEEQEEKMEE